MGWTRWWRGRQKWGTPCSTDASRKSKDAAVLTEGQVNTGRNPWLLRRNIRIHTELSRTKERRDKEEGERRRRARGTSLHLGWGSWSSGERSPHPWPSTGMGKSFEAVGCELINLWLSEQSENQIDKPFCWLSYLGQGCKSTGVHRSCELEPWGLWNDPRVRTPVARGKLARWDRMEEICCIKCFLRKATRLQK